MVRFDKIFWRQISAAGLTVVAHSILTGSPEESMIIFWIYVSILMLQEWIFDRNKRRNNRNDLRRRSEMGIS